MAGGRGGGGAGAGGDAGVVPGDVGAAGGVLSTEDQGEGREGLEGWSAVARGGGELGAGGGCCGFNTFATFLLFRALVCFPSSAFENLGICV